MSPAVLDLLRRSLRELPAHSVHGPPARQSRAARGDCIRCAHVVRPLSQRTAHSAAEMTERLYYTDAYRTHFEARVVEAVQRETCRVYLDRTAFYPTSGGQLHDVGRLADAAVVDVIDEGERI